MRSSSTWVRDTPSGGLSTHQVELVTGTVDQDDSRPQVLRGTGLGLVEGVGDDPLRRADQRGRASHVLRLGPGRGVRRFGRRAGGSHHAGAWEPTRCQRRRPRSPFASGSAFECRCGRTLLFKGGWAKRHPPGGKVNRPGTSKAGRSWARSAWRGPAPARPPPPPRCPDTSAAGPPTPSRAQPRTHPDQRSPSSANPFKGTAPMAVSESCAAPRGAGPGALA